MEELGLEDWNELSKQAIALSGQGDHAMALPLHQRALEHTPEDDKRNRAINRNNIALCHLNLEDWPQALTAATAATEEDKTYWRVVQPRQCALLPGAVGGGGDQLGAGAGAGRAGRRA